MLEMKVTITAATDLMAVLNNIAAAKYGAYHRQRR